MAEVFPESRHIGCYFHFTQALIKKLRSLGLITGYRFNQMFKKQMRKIFALAFLPVALVRNCYRIFANLPKFLALKARYPELQKFTEYFEKNWLDFFRSNSGMFLIENQTSEPLIAVRAGIVGGTKN